MWIWILMNIFPSCERCCFSPDCTSLNSKPFTFSSDRRQAQTPITFHSLQAASHKMIDSFHFSNLLVLDAFTAWEIPSCSFSRGCQNPYLAAELTFQVLSYLYSHDRAAALLYRYWAPIVPKKLHYQVWVIALMGNSGSPYPVRSGFTNSIPCPTEYEFWSTWDTATVCTDGNYLGSVRIPL